MKKELAILEEMNDEQLNALYTRLFSTDDGALVLEDLRQRCFNYLPEVPPNGQVDPYRTHVNVGMRSVLVMIETRLEPQPKGEENV
jgi:hypothetical protein